VRKRGIKTSFNTQETIKEDDRRTRVARFLDGFVVKGRTGVVGSR